MEPKLRESEHISAAASSEKGRKKHSVFRAMSLMAHTRQALTAYLDKNYIEPQVYGRMKDEFFSK